MFKQRKYKTYLSAILYFFVFVFLIIGNMVEFLMHFLITDSFTFLELPLREASTIEFFIFTVQSILLSLFSIIFVRTKKFSANMDRGICILFIVVNAIKLIFYFPSITIEKEYLFYLLKQYVPLVTNAAVVFFSFLQISEIEYNKYQ